MINTQTASETSLLIIGAGGHAVSVANLALALGYRIRAFVDAARAGQSLLGISIIADVRQLANVSETDCQPLACAIAIGDNSVREQVYKKLNGVSPALYFPALIHPSAVISHASDIGAGSVCMPGAIVGPNSRIGRFCILNTRASIDHDCSMADFSSLAPAAVTGGRVAIGERSAICIGAIVRHGVSVGQDCVLGAASYLHHSLEDYWLAYGTPAKPVRIRTAGEAYL